MLTLKQQLESLQAAHEYLQREHENTLDKVEAFEGERLDLIEIALAAQEAQRKLKSVSVKFELSGKPEQFLALVHGDLSFHTIVNEISKYSVVKRQGGITKLWKTCHLIYNDGYLFWYDSPASKEPQGTVKIDLNVAASKFNDIDNGFYVQKLDKSRAVFVFACPNAEECNSWLRVIFTAQGWDEAEIENYLSSMPGTLSVGPATGELP